MSAVVAIRNATQMLTADDRDHISGLIDTLKTKIKELNSDAAKRDKIIKTEIAKRTTLLKKIHDIEPHFTDEDQSYDDLKTVLDTAKSNMNAKIKEDKRRERLEKKWNDSGFDGDCPKMDNDTLDAHIKTLIKNLRDDKNATKKAQTLLLSAQNKRNKIFDKVSELGLKPPQDSSLEELQTILTRYNDAQKQRKKDEANLNKFRNLLDDIILKNPDAGIIDPPNHLGPDALENALKVARETRDNYKKTQKALEKTQKAQQRAQKKLAEQKKKSDDKAQKIANKDSAIKGAKKNGFFQNFTKYISDEIANGNIDSSLVDDAGGKGKFNSKKWAELDDSQKKDSTAPWNLISA